MFFRMNNNKGFTLVEMLMYISIMVVVGSVIASFLPELIRKNSYIQAKAEVLNNTRNAMETMAQEIKRASGVYTPTSQFGANPGQLSLETRINPMTGEELTYVDFYVDDDRLYVKRENQSAQLLLSEKIKINSLIFTHLNSAGDYPAIRISLTASYDAPSAELQAQSQINLVSTVSLRSY